MTRKTAVTDYRSDQWDYSEKLSRMQRVLRVIRSNRAVAFWVTGRVSQSVWGNCGSVFNWQTCQRITGNRSKKPVLVKSRWFEHYENKTTLWRFEGEIIKSSRFVYINQPAPWLYKTVVPLGLYFYPLFYGIVRGKLLHNNREGWVRTSWNTASSIKPLRLALQLVFKSIKVRLRMGQVVCTAEWRFNWLNRDLQPLLVLLGIYKWEKKQSAIYW